MVGERGRRFLPEERTVPSCTQRKKETAAVPSNCTIESSVPGDHSQLTAATRNNPKHLML